MPDDCAKPNNPFAGKRERIHAIVQHHVGLMPTPGCSVVVPNGSDCAFGECNASKHGTKKNSGSLNKGIAISSS